MTPMERAVRTLPVDDDLVRAVLRVYREPSDAMLAAGADHLFGAANEDWTEDALLIWQAMIDKALEEG